LRTIVKTAVAVLGGSLLILNRLFREGLTDKTAFEKKSENAEGDTVMIWG